MCVPAGDQAPEYIRVHSVQAWIALIEKDVQFNVLLATKHEKPEEFQQLYEV